MEKSKSVIGVDISTELTTYAVVDVRGNVLARDCFETLKFPDINQYITELANRIMAMVEANGGYENIRSVGISTPSGNFVRGSIVNSPNLPWKGEIPLAAMMRDRLGLAVAIANDAHVTALGEKVYGSAHGMKDFVLLNLGIGFGSCIFSRDREHLGADGFAGEIGHTCVVVDGRECGCGNKGCLETYVGAKGIVRTAQELMSESQEPSLLRQLEHLSPRTIAECCDKGDKLAIEVYRRTGQILGLGIANYASIVNPEAFIFAGGVSHAGKWLMEPTQESFERHVFHNIRGKVKLLRSILDDRERDVLGASALAWEVKEYSLFK